MLGLARFATKSLLNAVLVAAVFGVLSMVSFLFFILISMVVIVYVALTQDLKSSVVVMVSTVAAVLLSTWLLLSNIAAGAIYSVVFLLPVWVAGLYLSKRGNISRTVELCAVICTLLLLMFFLEVGDPVAWWETNLSAMLSKAEGLDTLATAETVKILAKYMVIMMPGVYLISWLSVLFWARWWQARIYQSVEFGAEFQNISLSRLSGFVTLGLFVFVMLQQLSLEDTASVLLSIALVMFLIQGLSVFHSFANFYKLSRVWAVLVYFLIGLIPQAMIAVSVVGILETMFSWRQKFLIKKS